MTHPDSPRRRPATAWLACLGGLLLALAACTTVAPTPRPSPSSAPSNPPSTAPSATPVPTTIDSAEAAAALVLASDSRFAGLKPRDPNLIGQCCWWTATQRDGGYDVTVEIGWGDCPGGCIERHRWSYRVTPGAALSLVAENGPPLPAGIPGPVDGTTGGPGIRGIASAGPVCPVVTPNDPSCADRPVTGATVHVIDATGLEVATLETDATGAFLVALPPGRYRVQADAVSGLMGTAPPVDVTVGAGLAVVQLQYDTGIR
jgi:carboxypeptidase family protein